MPVFVLDHGTEESAARFKALDSFTQGYIEAMFFTEMEHGTVREIEEGDYSTVWQSAIHSSLPGDVTLDDLSESAWKEILDVCADFYSANAGELRSAWCESGGEYDDSRAGHDFWLTRNRHGAGFWDRGLGKAGKALTDAAHPYGEANVYLGDDGLIYFG